MVHIGNRDFFAALKGINDALKAVLSAAARADYSSAWQSLARYFAERDEPRPLPDYGQETADLRPDSEQAKAICEGADRISRHEITGGHQTTFTSAESINFNADFGQSGLYDVHCMDWLSPLGKAYLVTGDGKYAVAFDDIFSQWYDQRDRVEFDIPALDPIWCELGCGCRSPVFMSLYYVFRRAPELRVETVTKLWKTFLGHGRWLFRREGRGYRRGNLQVRGCRSLMLLGGCYSERSPRYGAVGLGFVAELQDLADEVGCSEGERRQLAERMKSACRWYLRTSTPLRTSPATGDSGYVPIAPLMIAGARCTGDGTLLWPIRAELTEQERGSLPEPAAPDVTSVNLSASGFAVMRTGWEPDDLYMIINYGPYGGEHTHNHSLDFEVFAYGDGLALDTSHFGADDNPLDAYFRCARAHNQVVVNDVDMDRANLQVRDVVWRSDEEADFFSGTHDGYLKSHGVTITRKVVFVKPHYWLISDLVQERVRHHCYTWVVHSPHSFKNRARKGFVTGAGPGLLITPARPGEIRHVQRGTGYTVEDRCKPGMFPDRRWLAYRKFSHDDDFATFAVLLCPFREEKPELVLEPVEVSVEGARVERSAAEGFMITGGANRRLVTLSHAGARRRQYGPIETACRMGVFEEQFGQWRERGTV